jgi:hypothetical protein
LQAAYLAYRAPSAEAHAQSNPDGPLFIGPPHLARLSERDSVL